MKVLTVQCSPVHCFITSLRPVFECGNVKCVTVCRNALSQDSFKGKGRNDTLIPPRMTPNKYGVKILILKSGNAVLHVCHSCSLFCSVLLMIKIDMIHLFIAIGLPPGGSSSVHIYTQTVHRTTQNK
jgi:hypothetical protein